MDTTTLLAISFAIKLFSRNNLFTYGSVYSRVGQVFWPDHSSQKLDKQVYTYSERVLWYQAGQAGRNTDRGWKWKGKQIFAEWSGQL